jgi:pyruvate kinase
MDYRLVATLGPRSDSESVWQRLLDVGVTAFRLNTSHLSWAALHTWLDRLGKFLASRQPRPPLVLDLQGSKWRLGQFPSFDLVVGRLVTLTCAAEADTPGVLPVPHEDFFRAARVSSGELALDDAKIRLALADVQADHLVARVVAGGPILPRKGITYTDSNYRQERLNETDRRILAGTAALPGIQYALSYVKDAVEMSSYREQIGRSAFLIAKLERGPAVAAADRLAAWADELWLCRGDLGAELGPRAMAEAAHRFAGQIRGLPVPVLLAGQVFEHMTGHAAPTRAELCAAFDALQAGYAGFVLSDETAIGGDPVESCRTAALFR